MRIVYAECVNCILSHGSNHCNHDIICNVKSYNAGMCFQVFPPPVLPRNFRPFHSFEPSVSDSSPQPPGSDSFKSNRFTLSAPQRAAILGEEQLPGKRVLISFLKFLFCGSRGPLHIPMLN